MTKKTSWKLKLAAAVAVVAAGVSLLACAAGEKASQTGDPAQVGTGADQPAPKPSFHTPTAADFVLTVKILEKSCFGSAGCNVTYRIELAYQGAGPLDPGVTWEITYEIKGAEDPKIATLTVTGTEYVRDNKDFVQTPNKNTQLTAVVTGVGK